MMRARVVLPIVFACNTSQCINGVSYLHGEVSKNMFANLWSGYFPEENHVSYVTNGNYEIGRASCRERV